MSWQQIGDVLVGALALSAGRRVYRPIASSISCGRSIRRRALAGLVQSYVASLRRALGAEAALEPSQNGYALNIDRGRVDLLAFEDRATNCVTDVGLDPDVKADELATLLSTWETPLDGRREPAPGGTDGAVRRTPTPSCRSARRRRRSPEPLRGRGEDARNTGSGTPDERELWLDCRHHPTGGVPAIPRSRRPERNQSRAHNEARRAGSRGGGGLPRASRRRWPGDGCWWCWTTVNMCSTRLRIWWRRYRRLPRPCRSSRPHAKGWASAASTCGRCRAFDLSEGASSAAVELFMDTS